MAEWFDKTELSRNKRKLIEVLSIIDDAIVDITTIAISSLAVLFFIRKDDAMLPMHTIGDGLRKLMLIALVILAILGCAMLLD